MTKEKTSVLYHVLESTQNRESDKELQGGVEFTGKADDVEESWQREWHKNLNLINLSLRC